MTEYNGTGVIRHSIESNHVRLECADLRVLTLTPNYTSFSKTPPVPSSFDVDVERLSQGRLVVHLVSPMETNDAGHGL